MVDSHNNTAVVTGSAQGIGQAIARRLAADGLSVIVTDIVDGSETVDLIESDGGEATFIEADVTNDDDMAAVFEGESIDALVNNAAYYAPISGPDAKKRFDKIDRAMWDHVIEVNTTGVFISSKQAVPHLNNGASIVNISSGTFHSGTTGYLHYVTSKSSLIGMTRAMANELGDLDIRVNAVTPGLTASPAVIDSNQEGIERAKQRQSIHERLEPQHIANAVSFLVGPDSEMITGQVLNVNAGSNFY